MRQCGVGEDIGAGLGILDVCEDDDAVDETRRRRRFWRLDAFEGAEEDERDTDEAKSDSTDGGDESDTEDDDLVNISGVVPHGV